MHVQTQTQREGCTYVLEYYHLPQSALRIAVFALKKKANTFAR